MQTLERPACTHIPATIAAPTGTACQKCGDTTNLRLCTECGYVGCCESHEGHGREHALTHHHPVIKSLPLGDRSFTWCYECDAYV